MRGRGGGRRRTRPRALGGTRLAGVSGGAATRARQAAACTRTLAAAGRARDLDRPVRRAQPRGWVQRVYRRARGARRGLCEQCAPIFSPSGDSSCTMTLVLSSSFCCLLGRPLSLGAAAVAMAARAGSGAAGAAGTGSEWRWRGGAVREGARRLCGLRGCRQGRLPAPTWLQRCDRRVEHVASTPRFPERPKRACGGFSSRPASDWRPLPLLGALQSHTGHPRCERARTRPGPRPSSCPAHQQVLAPAAPVCGAWEL